MGKVVIDRDRCRLVIFDLDGTLVDTFEDITAAVNFALRELGGSPCTTSEVRAEVGQGVRKLMEGVIKKSGLAGSKAQVEALVDRGARLWMEYYERHPADEARIYPGVVEALKSLRAIGVKTAVLSNKVHRLARRVLEVVGLADFFDCILGAGESIAPKPSPQGVIFLMEKLGAKPDETYLIGDGKPDVGAGFSAGCHVCGVTYGILDRATLSRMGVRCIVDSLTEIVEQE